MHPKLLSASSSLTSNTWFKLICGASNNDVALVRNICAIYTSLGIDCIDISSDPAILFAAREGIQVGLKLKHKYDDLITWKRVEPFIMISVNDDEDPHFRKAYFDPNKCPVDCKRPCEKVCPAFAIPPLLKEGLLCANGVLSDKCYGCGRCIPICPLGLIDAKSYIVDHSKVNSFFEYNLVDAIEIHTRPGHLQEFNNLWNNIAHFVCVNAKIIAVSFPDMDNDTVPYLQSLQKIICNHQSFDNFNGIQIWQADGRPMSGDIGKGTTHACTSLASHVLSEIKAIGHDGINFEKKHFIQLAGGTNDYSAIAAKNGGLTGKVGFGGYAFGGYARKTISSYLMELDDETENIHVENHPIVLEKCLDFA